MKGLYYRLSPFTPDSAGAAALFADLPALIIPVDMNGTVSTFRGRVGIQPESRVTVCSILGNRELSYVMGLTDDFVNECLGLMERYESEFVVLLHGPVSSMVGLDLQVLAEEIEERTGKPALAVDCSGNEPYEKGLSAAMLEVFGKLKHLEPKPYRGTYNLLGLNAIDHNSTKLRSLFAAGVERATGGECLSVWGCRDGWTQWEQARYAHENILCSISALPLAKAMKREWGIPWRTIDSLGLCDLAIDGCDLSGLKTLVVSEQLMANIVRRPLEFCGCDVTVGTFHTLCGEYAQAQDCRIDSELEFLRLLKEKRFDLVIGDAALRQLVDGKAAFAELPHSAVARGIQNQDGYAPLTESWFASLEMRFAEADTFSRGEIHGSR